MAFIDFWPCGTGRAVIFAEVEMDYSNAPPPASVDQTIARPPIVNGDPYSEPVWNLEKSHETGCDGCDSQTAGERHANLPFAMVGASNM